MTYRPALSICQPTPPHQRRLAVMEPGPWQRNSHPKVAFSDATRRIKGHVPMLLMASHWSFTLRGG
jgi:hypothetical protein